MATVHLQEVSCRGNGLEDAWNVKPEKTHPGLTHISDALGYLIDKEFGLPQQGAPSQPSSSDGSR